jgi:hypothetical protein
MLKIEQIVNGVLIAECRVHNTAVLSRGGIVYDVVYQTTIGHLTHPDKTIKFSMSHRYADGVEKLISKVYSRAAMLLSK